MAVLQGLVASLMMAVGTPQAKSAPPPEQPAPSVAVFTLQVRAGLPPDSGELLTNQIVGLVRRSGTFRNVLSSSELEAVAGLEFQKQLLDCDNNACVAELAGSLAVSHILTGSLGVLGESLLLDLKLIRVSGGITAMSVSRRVRSGPKAADQLLDLLPGAVDELLRSGGVAAVEANQTSAKLWPTGAVAGAVAAGALALVPLLAAAALGVANGAFVLAVYGVVPLPVGGVPFLGRLVTVGGLGAAALLLTVGALALGGTAIGLLAAGIWGWSQP